MQLCMLCLNYNTSGRKMWPLHSSNLIKLQNLRWGSESDGPCMQIDPGRWGQTSSPPQTVWMNLTLRPSLTLAEPLKFSTHGRIRTRPRLLTSPPYWTGAAFLAAIITVSRLIWQHYHRQLPQTQCQHAHLGQGSTCMWSLRWKGDMAGA